MKNFRKLFVAAIMLVVALTAVISSTYAWFTLQNEVTVEEMDLQVGTAGLDLQISSTGGNDFGYKLTLTPDAGAELKPVTLHDSDHTFYQLVEDTDVTSYFKYEYGATNSFKARLNNSTSAIATQQYLEFDLWFTTSSELSENDVMQVSLFVGANDAALFTIGTGGNARVLKALRIAFVPTGLTDGIANWAHDDAVIYEPNYEPLSTYGNGEYFDVAKKWISPTAFEDFIKPFTNGDTKYILEESGTYISQYETTTNSTIASAGNLLPIIKLTQGQKTARVRVFIWIEGWDGDANNIIAESVFKTYLQFSGEKN